MGTLKALVFDVDGTLADTEMAHMDAFNHAFAEEGLDWRWDVETYTRLLEISGGKERMMHYWKQVHPDVKDIDGGGLKDTIDRLHAMKSAAYENAVQSFAVYGFPESHAISFALLAYASCWLKVHRASEFYCGLLNNQPMGFYAPATLVQDARRHGVRVRPVCVQSSGWRCGVEEDGSVRMGYCLLRGMTREEGERLEGERGRGEFGSLADFQVRSGLGRGRLRSLAAAGALAGLSRHRREAQWRVEVPRDPDDLFAWAETREEGPLEMMTAGERLGADYETTGLTLGPHPMKLLRPGLAGVTVAAALAGVPAHQRVRAAGMVICRQRPGTAKGIVFISLEDETGTVNAVVYPDVYEKNRLVIAEERFLEIEGAVQTADGVTHLRAWKVRALRAPLPGVLPESHDFR